MEQSLVDKLGLPPIDQVGYVVRDLDRAIETFGAVFGPFQTMVSELQGTNHRGQKSDVTLKMGFGSSGPLEIELIEPVTGGSPHRDVLEQRGEGVHHIRFQIPDLDPPLAGLEELGFRVIWSHEMPELPARWAYLEGPSDQGGALIEIYQPPSP
ncbi:MAG: VOC family protein [Myxococcota bacterium]|nr:VOC family protein [Myxococcota bacterium]